MTCFGWLARASVLVCLAPSLVTALLSVGQAGAADQAHAATPPAAARQPVIWPGRDWAEASPESQGLAGARLEAAAAYALKYGGGSGCVIRHGYLVKEWGSRTALADIKSATKGTLGATLLGLAVDDRRLKLDDPARRHYPAIGSERPENIATGWLGEITVRHLATMTAGFTDDSPPRLVRRPGTGGEYSNDTPDMLAELLTLLYKEDLLVVLKRRVMDPLGVPANEWKWRPTWFRPKTIHGLPSREFASGLNITHRALARLGYLYLRQGEWNGRRILSKEFILEATTPTTLPAPFDYYAFYWGSNARNNYPEIPRDAFWALGFGDSMVVVCPSLDLVAVRLGVGSITSRFPTDGDERNWGKRVASFFRLVSDSVTDSPSPARSPALPGPSRRR